MIMKTLTWLVFAVSLLPSFSFCSLFDISHLLDLDRVQADAALGNSPLWFGGTSIFSSLFRSQLTFVNLLEWSLSTEFSATDEFLKKWADAQKLTYGKGAGWFVSHPFFFPLYLLPSRIINQLIELDSSGTLESRTLRLPDNGT